MYSALRSILIWVLAIGGVLLFGAYVVAAGVASLGDPISPPTIKPQELVTFGVAAGTLLATNLGAVLGIAIQPPNRASWSAVKAAQQEPWAQLGGALVYLILLGVAAIFYWQSDWSPNAASVLSTSLSTLFGVFLGAMTAVFGAKPT